MEILLAQFVFHHSAQFHLESERLPSEANCLVKPWFGSPQSKNLRELIIDGTVDEVRGQCHQRLKGGAEARKLIRRGQVGPQERLDVQSDQVTRAEKRVDGGR